MENFYFTEIYNMHEIVIEYRIVLISCWDLHSALEVLAPLVFKRGEKGVKRLVVNLYFTLSCNVKFNSNKNKPYQKYIF